MLARKFVGGGGAAGRIAVPAVGRRWQHSSTKPSLSSANSTTTSFPPSIQRNASPEPAILAAYPIFNLNDERGRALGPRPGDEAILTLSGGVDSSVAAYLAVSAGGLIPHRTIFMRNWNTLEEGASFAPGAGGAEGCQWMQEWERVERMARWLDVRPELVDLSTNYWNDVFAPSLDVWQSGLTPNPDVLCNRAIKFGELLRRVDDEEAPQSAAFGRRVARRWLVTGHYAHLEYFYPASKDDAKGMLHGKLLRAKDANKDQSYFLSGVGSVHLGRSHFPLANIAKPDVRRTANTLGFPTSDSKESMGLCFVGKRKPERRNADEDPAPVPRDQIVRTNHGFAGFLNHYIENSPGAIVTPDGQHLGQHDGLHTLTIGQGARLKGKDGKYYVAAKDRRRNQVVVVQGVKHAMLQCRALRMDDFRLVCPIERDDVDGHIRGLERAGLHAHIRHRDTPVPCRAVVKATKPSPDDDRSVLSVQVHFDKPLGSVSEGQTCALYNGRQCLGGGAIASVETVASVRLDKDDGHEVESFSV